MFAFLTCLWLAGIVARLCCAVRILRLGITRAYWPLGLVAGLGGLMHAYGFWVWMILGYEPYLALWAALEPYQVIWDALLLVGVVKAGSRNFRHGTQLAWWLSAILLISAGGIAFLLSRVRGTFPDDLVAMALFAERNRSIFAVVFTAFATFAFTRLAHGNQLRRNSSLTLWVSMLLFTTSFLGNQIGVVAGHDYAGAATAQFFLMGGPLLCFGLWACKLRRSGETHIIHPLPQAAEVAASEEGLQEAKRRLEEMRRGR